MTQYGMNKATEFSKKQIGVIYRLAKTGELKVEKWFMSDLYDLAEYYGYDNGGMIEYRERDVLRILDCIFAGDMEAAQNLINIFEEKWFNMYTKKYQAKINREQLVA